MQNNELSAGTAADNSTSADLLPSASLEQNGLLCDGFGEDDWCEGVFLIEAKSKETFFNRKRKLEIITGFSDGFFNSYEEGDEGGIWKTITSAWFPTVKELKESLKKMKKYNWLFLSDSSIMLNGEYLFLDGKWFV